MRNASSPSAAVVPEDASLCRISPFPIIDTRLGKLRRRSSPDLRLFALLLERTDRRTPKGSAICG
jgi:hypothetical protein